VVSFERSLLKREARTYSANFIRPPSLLPPSCFRAPPCFLIGVLEIIWNSGVEKSKRLCQRRNYVLSCCRRKNVFIIEVNKPLHPPPPSTCIGRLYIRSYICYTERIKTKREAGKMLMLKILLHVQLEKSQQTPRPNSRYR
jgi:hypothetical protein